MDEHLAHNQTDEDSIASSATKKPGAAWVQIPLPLPIRIGLLEPILIGTTKRRINVHSFIYM